MNEQSGSSTEFTESLRAEALRLGFDAVGIAPAVEAPGFPAFVNWLEQGFAAGMTYLERTPETRAHPDSILPGVRSIVMAAISYHHPGESSPNPTAGKIARYARGLDYHKILWRKLDRLLGWVRERRPGTHGRAVADTAPLLERDYARLAGLGWIGKNTMLISRSLGSETLLGALLLDVELTYDPPHAADHCGTCTRCLDACPTDAFPAPGRLDARECLSYWTIEHRGPIPERIAERLDGWVFGCDICQEVCPWNRKARPGRDPELAPRDPWRDPDLIAWLGMDDETFAERLRGTALKRAKRSGLIRNAALALGQRRARDAEGVLTARLSDPDPGIRAACAWSLGRLGTASARLALERARDDRDPAVRTAIVRALDAMNDVTSPSRA